MDKKHCLSIGPLRPKGLEVTAAEKAEWARRFDQSGLSMTEFGARYGLRRASLCNWRVKYAEDICGQPEPDFMEVQLPAMQREPAWSVELAFGNGKVLRLNGEVPEGLVEQLLRVC